jgi:hypothetical protein
MLELKNRARDLDHKKRTEQCFGLEEQLKLETSRKGVRRKLDYWMVGQVVGMTLNQSELCSTRGQPKAFGLYLDTRHKRRPRGKCLHVS